MHVPLLRKSCLFAWPAAVALILAAGPGQALAQPERLGKTKAAVEGPYRKLEQEINRYVSGQKQASGPADKEAVEAATAAAVWFVYRLDDWFAQPSYREFLPTVVKEFDRSFMDLAVRNKATNKAFMQIYNKQMIALLKNLMAQDFNNPWWRVPQINGAVMLPVLARYGDEDVGDYLTEMLKDPKLHDALKVYALKGLREFFAASPPQVDRDEQKVRPRDAARVEVLLAFLTRPAPKDAPPEEVEAWRFIRREAIKALAQTRMPAAVVDKTGVKVPVALGLMKVLAPEKNGLAPTSSLTEKGEAAIGLCRMNAKDFERYKPEATVYLVGKFLVEFATKYREDEPNFGGKTNRPPLLPWKYYAERLEQSLLELQKQANVQQPPNPAYQQNVKVLLDHTLLPLLGKMKRHDRIDAPDLLENALAKMWPAAPALGPYQGVPSEQIQVPALKEAP